MQAMGAWALKPLVELTPAEFADWQSLVEERTGLVVSEQRRTFLEASLSARMREVDVPDYRSYFSKVTDGRAGAIEWSSLVDRLTVQETRFFRHGPSFDFLGRYLAARLGRTDFLSLWSLGCSTGEEAYSLAIAATEAIAAHGKSIRFGVTGTDISLSALEAARAGCFTLPRLVDVSPTLQGRYFQPSPHGRFTVAAELKERVCFARLNALELESAPMTGMDVIFCQNLLIYFRRWRRREILNRLAERLAPDGVLVIGVGEVVDWRHPEMRPVEDDQVLAFIRETV
ncbi:protein-glutamate O-methyltransferase CheR [Stutzerimonas urumqiensis]|uniref:CheR family methyltransferase n=1 Tax=Stutzerimonas urumqiensis TaxID=638269 RepID=UPI003BAADE08